jgi:Bax protein
MERNFLIKNIRRIFLPLLLIIIFIFGACGPTGSIRHSENIHIIRKTTSDPDKTEVVSEYIIPQDIEDSISLDSLSVSQRKIEFINIMLPAVLAVKAKLDMNREKVIALENKPTLSQSDKIFLGKLENKYKTHNLKVLTKRLRTFPTSIVLAQAAIESGWGTSRFFQEANNPFGMWSFSDSHARVKALSGRAGKHVYLRKFNTLQASIEAYYTLLATGRTFQDFRNLKMETDQPLKLIQALNSYSERGTAYVNDLASVIVSNKLQQYDHYEIGPQYLAEEVN